MTRLGNAAWANRGAPDAVAWRKVRDAQLKALNERIDGRHLPADRDPSADDRAEAAAEVEWESGWTSDRACEIDENRTGRWSA